MLLGRRRSFAATAGDAINYLDSFRNWERQGVPAGAGCDSRDGFDLVRNLPITACLSLESVQNCGPAFWVKECAAVSRTLPWPASCLGFATLAFFNLWPAQRAHVLGLSSWSLPKCGDVQQQSPQTCCPPRAARACPSASRWLRHDG